MLLWQATEVIKILLGKGDVLSGRLLVYDALKMSFKVRTWCVYVYEGVPSCVFEIFCCIVPQHEPDSSLSPVFSRSSFRLSSHREPHHTQKYSPTPKKIRQAHLILPCLALPYLYRICVQHVEHQH